MTKLEKNILHRIDFPKNKQTSIDFDIDNMIANIHIKVATDIREKYDEAVLNLIYQEYKNSDYDSVIVLDKSEFKYFLLKYLPIYLEERNND